MKNYIINILVVTILLPGCVKKADISLPKTNPKLVVTCFISPQDTVIGAVIRLSKPKSGVNGSAAQAAASEIKNASVQISDGNSSRTLIFDPVDLYYKVSTENFKVIAGKVYTLNVSTPDGQYVFASTRVPAAQLEILSLENRVTEQTKNKIETEVALKVKDIPEEDTYLAVFYHNVFTPENIEEPFSVFGYFDTDEKTKKSTFHHQGASTFYHKDSLTSAMLEISVLNCSKEFYYYNKSVQESGVGSLNPFADPVMVYTNINNGFGCFGAYNMQRRTIELR